MKKILLKVLSVVMIIVTIGVVLFVMFYTGILNKKDVDNITVYTYSNDAGLIYTEAEWTWKPIESKKVLSYVDTSNVGKQIVTMNISNEEYFDITLPEGDYIYDYGYSLWSIDGSYSIRVIKDVTMDTLSSMAGIDNGVSVNQITLCSQEKTKGAKTIATLVGNNAIVANIYYGDDTFSVIYDNFINGIKTYSIDDVPYADSYVKLSKLSYSGRYIAQVVFQQVDLFQTKYLFADGNLWQQSEVLPLSQMKDLYLAKLYAASKLPISEIYDGAGMFYAKSGDYYVGLLAYNTNTTIVLFGKGEEAKCNIISVMAYLK